MFGDLLYDNKSQVSLKNCTKFIDYRGKTPEKCSMGIRLITAKNVRMHNLNFEPAEFIPEENFDKIMTRGFPKSGDILFTTEAPLGYVCVIPEMKEKFCVGQRLITIVPDERINSIYLVLVVISIILSFLILLIMLLYKDVINFSITFILMI